MPPNNKSQVHVPSGVVSEHNIQTPDDELVDKIVEDEPKDKKIKLVWFNIIWFIYLHITGIYGLYLGFTSAKWQTCLLAYVFHWIAGIGITVGVHRLWTHRTYTAKLPLRIILMLMNTVAFQGSILDWSKDHRVHHKYSDTEADPHNSNRGFFYSHIGWLCCKKNKETIQKGKQLDISDLLADPVVVFQKKYYLILMPSMCFALPTFIAIYCWNESFINAWSLTLTRYLVGLHVTWSINSVLHVYGARPYDGTLRAFENIIISLLTFGEGFHNYHHTFPWDYKAAECRYHTFANPSTRILHLMAWLGQATNLKSASKHMIDKRMARTGDGTRNLWGWNDSDMNEEDIKFAHVSKIN